jgi:hypothetical protein
MVIPALFAAVAGLAAAQVPAPMPPLAPGSVSFDPAVPAALEVERAPTGHLLVKPTINGHDAGWFIFDTGAGICVVSTKFVEELELKPAGQVAAVGFGSENADVFTASTLALGSMTLRDHPVMETDLSFLTQPLGREIGGVIGFGVLSNAVAEIDLVTPGVALHDPSTFALTGAEWQPVELATRIPVIRAKFEDREGTFTIDTGASATVSFHKAAVDKWSLLDGRELRDGKVGGVGGFIAVKNGAVDWFELGGLRQEDVAAMFELEEQGSGNGSDGNIGAGLLRPFVLVTDYTNSRVAFRPREAGAAEDGEG